jgi:hypothetical protein
MSLGLTLLVRGQFYNSHSSMTLLVTTNPSQYLVLAFTHGHPYVGVQSDRLGATPVRGSFLLGCVRRS